MRSGYDPCVADYADGKVAPCGASDTVLDAADYLIAVRIVRCPDADAQEMLQVLVHIYMNTDGQIDAGDLILLLQAI